MNSNPKSEGKLCRIVRLITFVVGIIFLLGCSTSSENTFPDDSPVRLAEELNEEVSLKSDRAQLNEIRKKVPEDKKVDNDELAMDLELMATADKPAHEIRGKFQHKVRKLRAKFREKSSKIRKKFRDIQKKRRDQFLKNLKEEREDFKSTGNRDREKTKDFFAEQDVQRKDFFAQQKDERKAFESEMRQKSKDFHGNMRERERQFNEQLRIYSKRKREKERLEKKKKHEAEQARKETLKSGKKPLFKRNDKLDSETQKILKEFDEMKSLPKESLNE